MFKKLIVTTALTAALLTGAAQAQDNNDFQGPYIVGELGYDNGPFGFDQVNYGGAAGYNFRLGPQAYFGAEVDIAGSSSDIVDFTYGIHSHLGYIVDDRNAVFARAGYREFEFDLGGGFAGFSDGDYSLGLGAQHRLTPNLSLRGIVDTVGFDTLGVRTGLVLDF